MQNMTFLSCWTGFGYRQLSVKFAEKNPAEAGSINKS